MSEESTDPAPAQAANLKRKIQELEDDSVDPSNTEVRESKAAAEAPATATEDAGADEAEAESAAVEASVAGDEEKKTEVSNVSLTQTLRDALVAAIDTSAEAALAEIHRIRSAHSASVLTDAINFYSTPPGREVQMSPLTHTCAVMARGHSNSDQFTAVLKEMMLAGGDPYNKQTITDASLYIRANRHGAAIKEALGSAEALEVLLEHTKDLSILQDMLQFDKTIEVKNTNVRMLLKNHGLLPLKRRKLTAAEMEEYSEDPYGDDVICESRQEIAAVEEWVRGAGAEPADGQPVFDEVKDPEWTFADDTPDVELTDDKKTASYASEYTTRTVFLNHPLLPSSGTYTIEFKTTGSPHVYIGIAQWGMDKTTRLGSNFPYSGFAFASDGDRALLGRLHSVVGVWPANAKATLKVDFAAGSLDVAVNGKWKNATFSGHNLAAQGPWFAAVSLAGPGTISLVGVKHSAK